MGRLIVFGGFVQTLRSKQKGDCRSHFDSMSEMRGKKERHRRRTEWEGRNLLKGKDIEQTESGSIFPEREEKALCICGQPREERINK